MRNSTRRNASHRINPTEIYALERRRTELLRSIQDARLEADMTLEVLADTLGRSVAFVNNEETGAREDIEPGIIKIDRLCRTTGSIKPIEALARVNNCALIPLPELSPSDTKILAQISKVLNETGEAIAEMGKALKDGLVTDTELQACKREIRDAVEALLKAEANLEARAMRQRRTR